MPGTPHIEGLLGKGMATGEGKHLYHETKAPVIAYTADQEAAALADGYQETYIHQEYPKFDAVSGKTFKSAGEESASTAAFIAAYPDVPVVEVPIPKAPIDETEA